MNAEEIAAKLQQIARTDVRDFMMWDPRNNTVTLKNPRDSHRACAA